MTALDETPLNVPPTAQFTATRTGPTITFDASASTDADGTTVEYLWDFGDGELATGAAVTHTFEPGAYEVALVATDDAGGKGFTSNAEDIFVVGGEPRQATVYSASSLTLTNAFTVAGDTSGVLVEGDFTCNSRGTVAGDVTVTDDAYLTNECFIGGTLWVAGNVAANSRVELGGDLRAGGDVSLQSTVRIAGSVATTGCHIHRWQVDRPVASRRCHRGRGGCRGRSPRADLLGAWRHRRRCSRGSHASHLGQLASGNRRGGGRARVVGGAQACAGVRAGLVHSRDIDGHGGGDTFVDARQSGTGCGSVSLQELTIDLQGDLTIVADGIRSANGLVVTASDGEAHQLRLITPGSVRETVTGGGITLLGTTDIDPAVAVSLQTPGTLQVNGPAHLSGEVIAGRVIGTGTVAIHSEIPRQPL